MAWKICATPRPAPPTGPGPEPTDGQAFGVDAADDAAPAHDGGGGATGSRWRFVRADGGLLGGVCAGLARSAGVDVVLVRMAFVLAALSGIGVLAYLALVLLAPREDVVAGPWVEPAPPETARIIRTALAVGALLGLTSSIGGWPYDGFPLDDTFGALGLMLVVGGAIVLLSRRSARAAGARRSEPTPVAPPPAPSLPSPVGPAAVGSAPWPAEDSGALAPSTPRPSLLERFIHLRWRVIIARAVALLAAILGSLTMLALALLDASGALSVGMPALVGTLLVLGTIGVIATSVVAPPVWPTSVAVVVLLAGGGLAAATSDWEGYVGDREVVVTRPDALAARYDLAIGTLTLDLSALELGGTGTGQEPIEVAVEVDAGIGQVDVVVPDDVRLVAQADAAIGEVELPRDETTGLAAGAAVDDEGTGSGVVSLDLHVGIGAVSVCRAADVGRGDVGCP